MASPSSHALTATQQEQLLVEERVQDFFKILSPHNYPVALELWRDQHIDFLQRGINHLGPGHSVLDANRPWLCYWILHSMALLGEPIDEELRQRTVSFLCRCQDPNGGYGGGPGQMAHLATTYAAVNALVTVGGETALASINRENMLKFLQRMKDPSGGFRMHDAGEIDVRGSYTAVAIAKMLGILIPALMHNLANYIVSCQTFEGGIGGEPGAEAHGGYTFCGLAALILINESHQLDLPSLLVVETRFATHYIVLKRLVDVKQALKSMVISDIWAVWRQSQTDRANNVRRLILDEDWWAQIDYLLSFTEPIYTLIRRCDTDKPILGDIYDCIDTMVEQVRDVIIEKEQDPSEFFYKQIYDVIKKRWDKMTTPLQLLAYALNPKYYHADMLALPNRTAPNKDVEVVEGYKKAFKKMFTDPRVAAEIRDEFGTFASSDGTYADVDAMADKKKMDPIKWWNFHGAMTTHLQKLAIKLLSQDWAVFRQGRVEGGFQGRTNKLVDGCYSFWQGGVFPLIQRLLANMNQQASMSYAKNKIIDKPLPLNRDTNLEGSVLLWESSGQELDVTETNLECEDTDRGLTAEKIFPVFDCFLKKSLCIETVEEHQSLSRNFSREGNQGSHDSLLDFLKKDIQYGPLFNTHALQGYLLLCSQVPDGGLRDKPGKSRDYYHTCYCLSGLSTAQYSWSHRIGTPPPPAAVLGPFTNLLEPIHPLFNVVLDRYYDAQRYLSSM